MQRYYPILVALAVAGIGGPEASADAPVTTVYFTGGSPREASACPAPVAVRRHMGDGEERFEGELLDCEGRPRPEAVRALSVLARPRGLPLPDDATLEAFDAASHPGFVAEGVRALHPELLARLQRVAEAFEGHRIEILSGYRPTAPPTSRHHHGRALDLRVADVEREAVRDLLAGLERTGVGWYPNSVFVHLDVRDRATYWVDESGPGEAPRYVRGATPPGRAPAEETPPPPEIDLEALRSETEAALAGIRVEAP